MPTVVYTPIWLNFCIPVEYAWNVAKLLLRLAPPAFVLLHFPHKLTTIWNQFSILSTRRLTDTRRQRDWVREWGRQQQRRSGLRAGTPIRALVVVVVVAAAVFACCDTLNIPLGQSTCLQSAVPYPFALICIIINKKINYKNKNKKKRTSCVLSANFPFCAAFRPILEHFLLLFYCLQA